MEWTVCQNENKVYVGVVQVHTEISTMKQKARGGLEMTAQL